MTEDNFAVVREGLRFPLWTITKQTDDFSSGEFNREALSVLDAIEAEMTELHEALRAAPAFTGVWNIAGKRYVSEANLSAFVEAYNAWATDVRLLLGDSNAPEEKP